MKNGTLTPEISNITLNVSCRDWRALWGLGISTLHRYLAIPCAPRTCVLGQGAGFLHTPVLGHGWEAEGELFANRQVVGTCRSQGSQGDGEGSLGWRSKHRAEKNASQKPQDVLAGRGGNGQYVSFLMTAEAKS